MSKKAKCVMVIFLAGSLLFTGCASSTKSTTTDKSDSTSVSSKAETKTNKFEMYNKVSIGMTKAQVDTAVKVTPTESTDKTVVNHYIYKGNKDVFGVSVLYNEQNKAYSKTVNYKSNSDIAFLTAKPVTAEQEKKITEGMTYQEVKRILGGDGVECSITASDKTLSIQGVIRRWANSDGSFAQVVFSSNEKVEHASYFKH
jgi:hypothetical protein